MIGGVFRRCENKDSLADTALEALAGQPPHSVTSWIDHYVGFSVKNSNAVNSSLQLVNNNPHDDAVSGLTCIHAARLDNKPELINKLNISHSRKTQISDSELILSAYLRWGSDCPSHLVGDYAFSIWDPRQRKLFCARDPIGVQPFYYSLTADMFVFSSTLGNLLNIPCVPQCIDEQYVAASLLFNPFTHNTQTYFKDIIKLPPGHSLTVSPDSQQLSRYWFPERANDVRYKSDDEYAEALQELLSIAITARLPSGHNIGVHLSGGLDSSGIAVLAARELRKQDRPPPLAFCWQPPPDNNKEGLQNDYALIQSICDQEGLKPRYCSLNIDDVLRFLHQDPTREPFTATNVYEQLVQQQAEQKDVQVILSGWGGDDGISFNRRGYYPGLLMSRRWQKLYHESKAGTSASWKFILSRAVLPLIAPDSSLRILRAIRHKQWPYPPKPFINPSFSRQAKPLQKKGYLLHGIRQVQLQMLASGQITARLEGWAASGAKHNISYCYPLLDQRVLEFALGLPPEQFQRGEYRRWIMRNALNSVLPDNICWSKTKAEPARVKAFFDILPEVLKLAAQTVNSRPDAITRAKYIDIPRLLKHLDPEHFQANPKWGNIGAALQLLDWE